MYGPPHSGGHAMTERLAIARMTKSGRLAPTPFLLRKTGSHASLAAAVLIALRAPSIAYAQEQAEPRKPSGLEEITVTATRRELNLQEVPQSIAAFSNDD